MTSEVLSYATALRQATARLAPTSRSPRLDAELLLAAACGVSRTRLLAEWDTPLSPCEQVGFEELVARRAVGEPIAYILGRKEFYGRPFIVDPRVLVPRPETELLIEQVLDWARGRDEPAHTIADIGIGSGCIAITLALELPHSHVIAVDISVDALAVARQNAALHDVSSRLTLLQGDGFGPLQEPVDVIASNPPYTILEEVEPDVRRWEPHLALDGKGEAGLDMIGTLLAAAPPYLRPTGLLVMEIGAWQGCTVQKMAQAAFPKAQIAIRQDLAGRDRLLVLQP